MTIDLLASALLGLVYGVIFISLSILSILFVFKLIKIAWKDL